ncbi:MAG: histidinol-phosphatase [Eubacteriales bacterium]|nr:histidinol-phosphatase [Eubacteriales bacterium]
MKKVDLHIHTIFSDGKNTPEEIVKSAIVQGISVIGFSDHSYTAFDESYCIGKDKINEYINDINSLKEKYKECIELRLGIEQDFYSDMSTDEFDYVIGSVHYIKVNDNYIPIDESKEILIKARDKYFNGDIYSLIEEYYKTVSDVVNKTNADIIGHIDLISKFNENNELFEEQNERYIAAYKNACDVLIKSEKPFEINTGAISRGYKSTPYPASDIYKYLKNMGAKFILSSDSHGADTLCYDFDKYMILI